MARIRTIKPELFQHSDLYDLELETELPIRLAWIALFTCCDREGRFKWRPRELKLQCLPYDDCDFTRVLDALATRGFIVKYMSGLDAFGHIPSWTKHQYINNREAQSEIPKPNEVNDIDASGARDPREENATPTRVVKEGKGREEEGKGKDTPMTAKELSQMVAKRLQVETSLKSPDLHPLLAAVALQELETGVGEQGTFDAMAGAWRDYEMQRPAEFAWGAKTFLVKEIGSGHTLGQEETMERINALNLNLPQSSQGSSPVKKEILSLLGYLADMRQAKPSEQTYINYAQKLSHFQTFDIQTAVEEMAMRERRDGETAFPAIATLVGFVKAVAERRIQRKVQEKLSYERQHYLDHPMEYCSLREISDAVDIITAKRAAGDDYPNPGPEPRPDAPRAEHQAWQKSLHEFLMHFGVSNDARFNGCTQYKPVGASA